jgi:transposase
MDRGAAAKIGGMDRQTLRDWVHRFNACGLDGLLDNWTRGPKPRLSEEQMAQFAQIVEAGPDRKKDGVGAADGSGANGRIWPAMMSAELPEGWAWAS